MTSTNTYQDYAKTVLKGRVRQFEIQDVLTTRGHTVLKISTEGFGILCLKIANRALGTTSKERDPHALAREIRIYREMAGLKWVPEYLASDTDNMWMLRRWCGDQRIEKIRSPDWTLERLYTFWEFISDVLEYFHGMKEPQVVRDIKPQNISYDGSAFFFFDFSAAVPLSTARQSRREPRMGNKSNFFMAPEIVQSEFSDLQLNSDLFSFGTMMAKFVTGKYAWSNRETTLEASQSRYLEEYALASEKLEKRLARLEMPQGDRAFLSACLHPVAAKRPDGIRRPARV